MRNRGTQICILNRIEMRLATVFKYIAVELNRILHLHCIGPPPLPTHTTTTTSSPLAPRGVYNPAPSNNLGFPLTTTLLSPLPPPPSPSHTPHSHHTPHPFSPPSFPLPTHNTTTKVQTGVAFLLCRPFVNLSGRHGW